MTATTANSKKKSSPIYIQWDKLSKDKLNSLYRFGGLLQESIQSQGFLVTLLNLENEMSKVLLNVSSKERRQLQEDLKGMTIKLAASISDKDHGEVFNLPINIEPASILERAVLGKGKNLSNDIEKEKLKKFLFEMLKEEAKNKIKESFEGFFKGKLFKGGLKNAEKGIKDLVKQGAITQKGELASDTTLEDLLFGEYSEAFAKVANNEVINEGLSIEQTLASILELTKPGADKWTREAIREIDLIGSTLRALKS